MEQAIAEELAGGSQVPGGAGNGGGIPEVPRSLGISSRGVHTSRDFAQLMSSLMSDLLDGRVSPGIGNAVCNAGGKLLKVVELQQKYGTPISSDGEKVLRLAAVGE